MKRILLAAILLGFVGMALVGTTETTKPAVQLRMSAATGRLLRLQHTRTESHDWRWSQCGDVLPGYSGDVIPSELRNTNVGAMLGRADEEDILKPLTICENHKPG